MPTANSTLVVTRNFAAPPELVFDAWLDPATVGRWLFATPDGVMQRVEIDARVGGGFTVVEKRADMLAEHFGEYLELDRPRRLVFAFSTNRADKPTRVTVDFAPVADVCRVTLTHEMDPEWAAFVDRASQGWTMILEHLNDTLVTDRQVVSRRVFDAPRQRVYEAFSDPNQLARWWGPSGFTNTIETFDLRSGGIWKLVMHGPNGVDYHNESVFVEVTAPERIVYDHLQPMHCFRMAMTLADRGDQTALTWRMLFPTADECEKVRAFVVPANEENFDRLAAHLRTRS
jgi:uncharacterized protein YndB with AHSA1/START domain